MRWLRLLLLAAPLSLVVTVLLAGAAAADNCDIFINAEDCQNTGWTVGVIATLAGGVAVATAATLASRPPPEKQTTFDGIGLRAMFTNPTTTIEPRSGVVTAHSAKLVAHDDHGRQTVREGHRGPD
jgi:hypothetical protein